MRNLQRLVPVFAVLCLAACGGGTSPTANDAKFCEYMQSVDDLGQSDDPQGLVTMIDDMIGLAPNDEVRGALSTLRPMLKRLADVDLNDQDAVNSLMTEVVDPKYQEAGKVLDKYSEDVCGMTATSDSTDAPAS